MRECVYPVTLLQYVFSKTLSHALQDECYERCNLKWFYKAAQVIV